MNAVIEDPMGLESGIRIDMVKTVTDRKAGRITIRGRMTACTKSPAVPDIEPEIECAIIDENDAIAEIALSRHNGCFWTNRQALWSIEIEDVDERIPWEEISMLHLRLIYCKSRSSGAIGFYNASGSSLLQYQPGSELRGLRLNHEQ